DDVEPAIWAELHSDGAEPGVRGGEELLPFVGRFAGEGGPFGLHDLAVDQIAGRVAGEDVAAELLRQKVATVNEHATGGCELPFVQVGGRPELADGIDAAVFGEGGHIMHDRGDGDGRGFLEIA